MINVFAKAAHAPEVAMRIDSRMFDFILWAGPHGALALHAAPVKRSTRPGPGPTSASHACSSKINYLTVTRFLAKTQARRWRVPWALGAAVASYAHKSWD